MGWVFEHYGVPALFACAIVLALGPLVAPLGRLPSRRSAAGVCALGFAGLALTTALTPAFDAQSPQRLSVAVHHAADPPRTRYLVDASSGPLPPSILAQGFGLRAVDPAPWLGGWRPEALERVAPTLELAPPDFELLERSSSQVRARIHPRRGGRLLTLHYPREAALTRVSVEGVSATPRVGERWAIVAFMGDASGGLAVEAEVGSPVEILVSEHTFGLPPEAEPLRAARPPGAVPSQLGDCTVVSRWVRL